MILDHKMKLWELLENQFRSAGPEWDNYPARNLPVFPPGEYESLTADTKGKE